MATQDVPLLALNAGEISRHALARVDLAKMRMSTERQANFLPHVLGPAMLRPGTQYISNVPSDAPGWLGEFYFSDTQKTLLVLTASGLRFLVADSFVSRPAVSAVIVNGAFTANIAGWTDSDEAGAVSTGPGGVMTLTGTGTNYAWRDQHIGVFEPGVEHGLRVVITRGMVALRVGTAQGFGDYLDIAELAPGSYSLAFAPAGDFWIRLGSRTVYSSFVDSIAVEPVGIVALPTPYSTKAHFDLLRYDQSGDVLFVACAGFQQRRIERRAANSRSWGVSLYQANDGPFRLGNVTGTTITPSLFTGSVTLTASRDLFVAAHVGALWRLTHSGQTAQATLGALNDTAGDIRISGLASQNGSASQRAFAVDVEAGLVGTVTLQRSIAAPGSWTDVESYATATVKTFDDGLDNQIIYYRLKVTAYTSGAASGALVYTGSSQSGICRLTGVLSPTVATADVLTQFGATTATSEWSEGEWSDYRGWPAAVALHDGRLAWCPGIKTQLSVSDAFASFDDTVEGDSGPINKIIATGGLDGIRWAMSLQRLIVATATQEISVRASAFDEPLTPTAFTARVCSTRGAAAVRPIKTGTIGIFVERNGRRVFELLYDVALGDYHSRELTRLKQEMCDAGVADVAIQTQPDTCIWFVLGDGTCAVLTYDQDDEVVAWTPMETDGAIERVATLPGTDEDEVYFLVARTIGGVTRRYIEKLAKRSEARGGTLSKTCDSHIIYSGAPTALIPGLLHLEGKTVAAWGDGAPVTQPFVVSGGAITLPFAVSTACVGLIYVGQIKTAKLAYVAEHGTALTAKKRVSRLGLVMADVTPGGIRIGRDFSETTGIGATYRGHPVSGNAVLSTYDAMVPFNGGWDEDSRVCIEVGSPWCCTIMGLALHMATNEPVDPPAPRERGQ